MVEPAMLSRFQKFLLGTPFGRRPLRPGGRTQPCASVRRRVTSAAMDSAAEPQNGSTSRVVLMGRYCRTNGASARWLP